LKEARKKADELKSTLNETEIRTQNYTVADAIDYYLGQKAKVVRPQSLKWVKSALRYAMDAHACRRLSDITVDDARELYDAVAQHSVSQANCMSQNLRQLYKDAVIRGIVKENPWLYVSRYKHEKAQKRALTSQEIAAISAAELGPWWKAYISVLRYTGMRKGEALALDVSDVDFDRKTVSISKTCLNGSIGPAKTKSSVRIVPMPEPLVSALHNYLGQYHTGEGLLFPSPKGCPARDLWFYRQWWKTARAIFGGEPPEDFTPHIFRHTYASELVRNKVPPTTAMLLLGHRSLSTTMEIYTHLGWQDIDAEQLNNIFRAF
jgi:integrase